LISFVLTSHHSFGGNESLFIFENFIELVIRRRVGIYRRLIDDEFAHFVDDNVLVRRQCGSTRKDKVSDTRNHLLEVKFFLDFFLFLQEKFSCFWWSTAAVD